MNQMPTTTPYDGCGKCFLGVRRLSRLNDATSSPERQGNNIGQAATENGGHIIAWADDWEVSGAVNPLERPEFGPWLRGEKGPYDGIVGSDVDRIGRDQLDVLMTGRSMRDQGKLLITYGHPGAWDLNDPNDEMLFSMKALGAQIELRQIQKRNREESVRAREAGQPRQRPSYGYRFVRLIATGKVDHVELDPISSKIIREVKDRILADDTGMITAHTEAARLTRAGVPSPNDHRAAIYGRKLTGNPWSAAALLLILRSEAALGYLMHRGRAVIDAQGNKIRLAPELWDVATYAALITKLAPKPTSEKFRAPKGTRLLCARGFCGNCGLRLYMSQTNGKPTYRCLGRMMGLAVAVDCSPSPLMVAHKLETIVEVAFLRDYGHIPVYRQEFDPGTGHEARTKALKAERETLRRDRLAGVYNDPDDEIWYQREYKRIGDELAELARTPQRPAGMYWVATGRTNADLWREAPDDAARRELLDQYNIKVVLYSAKHSPRTWVHGLDPDEATQARQEAAERAVADHEAYLDALENANAFTAQPEDVEEFTA